VADADVQAVHRGGCGVPLGGPGADGAEVTSREEGLRTTTRYFGSDLLLGKSANDIAEADQEVPFGSHAEPVVGSERYINVTSNIE
jgi:hypothetical protein